MYLQLLKLLRFGDHGQYAALMHVRAHQFIECLQRNKELPSVRELVS